MNCKTWSLTNKALLFALHWKKNSCEEGGGWLWLQRRKKEARVDMWWWGWGWGWRSQYEQNLNIQIARAKNLETHAKEPSHPMNRHQPNGWTASGETKKTNKKTIKQKHLSQLFHWERQCHLLDGKLHRMWHDVGEAQDATATLGTPTTTTVSSGRVAHDLDPAALATAATITKLLHCHGHWVASVFSVKMNCTLGQWASY